MQRGARGRWTRPVVGRIVGRIVAGALIGTALPVGLAVATAAPAAAAEAGGKSWFGGEDLTDAYGSTRLAWQGAAAYGPDRSGGRAFDLDEGGHLATGPAAARFGTGNFSVGFTARFRGGADEQVLSKSGACGTGLEIGTRGGALQVALRDADGAGATVLHPDTVRDGAWHEVSVIRTGPMLTVLVDGAPRSARADAAVDLDTSAPLRLGDGPCAGAPAAVLLDDVGFGPGIAPVGPPSGTGRVAGLLPGLLDGSGSGDDAPAAADTDNTDNTDNTADTDAAPTGGTAAGGSQAARPAGEPRTAPGAPGAPGTTGGAPGTPGARGAGTPAGAARDGTPAGDGAPGSAPAGSGPEAAGLPLVPDVLHVLGALGGTYTPGADPTLPLPGTPPVAAGAPAVVTGPTAPTGPATPGLDAQPGPAPAGDAAPAGPAAPPIPPDAGTGAPDPAAQAADDAEPVVVPVSGSFTGRSAIEATSVVPAPEEVRTDASSLLRSALMALVLLTLLVLPARMVNRTADANAARIIRRVSSGPARMSPPAVTLLGAGAAVAAYAVGAPLLGLDASAVALALGLAIAFLLVTAVAEVSRQVYLGRSSEQRGRLRRVPGFLLLGLGTVLLTRYAGLHAGVIIGALAAVLATSSSASYASLRGIGGLRDGRAKAVAAASLATVGALAWMLRDPLLGPAGEGFAGQILASGLTAVTVTAVVHLAFAMVPVRFLDGAAVLDWSRSRWVLLAGLGAFTLVHVLLQPAAGPTFDRGGFLTGAIGVHLAAAMLFVLWFHLRRGSRAAQPVG